MRILGVDVPGGKIGAWAVIEIDDHTHQFTQVLDQGLILLDESKSELQHYTHIRHTLERANLLYQFTLVVIEHPFLYRIAQYTGALKFWIAGKRGMSWYMITASGARKALFRSDPKMVGRTAKTQMKAKDAKQLVLDTIQGIMPVGTAPLTQHEADAVLYAIAGAIKQDYMIWEA